MKIPLPELGLDWNLGNDMWMNGHCCSGYPNCIHKPKEKKELKDCPFCGGVPNIKSIDHKNVVGFEMACKWGKCLIKPYIMATTIERCKEQWNARTAENEKSFLFIDISIAKKIAREAIEKECASSIPHKKIRMIVEGLFEPQNAKSFMSIQKE